MYWAILSGIEGNLAAYEAVMQDLGRQSTTISELYILGDLIGPTSSSEKLVQRVHNPRRGELKPQVCQGWWEEQCLILHGLGRSPEPTKLTERYGMAMVKTLWDSVSRETVGWLKSLDFGFFELDCLLIHGSSVSVEDELTPETSPLVICDRLARMGANALFCGRSGLTFKYQLQGGSTTSSLTTLNGEQSPHTVEAPPCSVIGVGSVGRIPSHTAYTLYNPGTGQVEFKTVRYGATKGFGALLSSNALDGF
ncbi:MAG: metallophosphatase [Aphanocapsa sp. GSE-SYN-MK-11-07L]|jgi:hypothetical protein|nr:metallophosphatase [Aphanocapsa sp. GSE-SYN-MK-11-07L]